jgi:hypothetical protein
MTGPNGPVNTWLSMTGLAVAADAKVVIDGKEAALADLVAWTRVTLRLAKDGKAVTRIEAVTEFKDAVPPRWIVKAVNANAGTVEAGMIGHGAKGVQLVVKGLAVHESAKFSTVIHFKIGEGYVLQFNNTRLADLEDGMHVGVEVEQGTDGKLAIVRIDACK